MPKSLTFSSSLVTKFSINNAFKTRVLLKMFDAKFPYKLSYVEPLCLPAKMAAETVTTGLFAYYKCNKELIVVYLEVIKFLKPLLCLVLSSRDSHFTPVFAFFRESSLQAAIFDPNGQKR